MCIYCEASLNPDIGHVEHIKSRDLNPLLMFAYDNLAHSCTEIMHCGHFKDNNVIPLEPRPGVNRHFVLSEITGQLNPDLALSLAEQQNAASTLSVLGLNNHPGLNRQRQQHAIVVRFLFEQNADITDFLTTAPFGGPSGAFSEAIFVHIHFLTLTSKPQAPGCRPMPEHQTRSSTSLVAD